MKLIKQVVVLLWLMVSAWSNAAENNVTLNPISKSPDECNNFFRELDDRFYSSDNLSQSSVILKEAKPCATTNERQAQLFDLVGEVSRSYFGATKDKTAASDADSYYQKALAFNTNRNESILWHLAQLKHETGEYEKGFEYISRLLDMKSTGQPKNILPYLKTAFLLSVDLKKWNEAYHLMGMMYEREHSYYGNMEILSGSVQTLCAVNKLQEAKNMIQTIEQVKDKIKLNSQDREKLEKIKAFYANCASKQPV